MLKEKVEQALNKQIELELFSSQLYLAMASWCEANGFGGSATFLFDHSIEEREHALKLIHYVNDRSGHAIIPALDLPKKDYDSVKAMFEEILDHEKMISNEINELVGTCLDERDFTTQNFLQWYVTEQIEEESLFSTILDKLNLLGEHKGSMFMFDSEMGKMISEGTESAE